MEEDDSAYIDDHIQVLGTLLGGIVRITIPSPCCVLDYGNVVAPS